MKLPFITNKKEEASYYLALLLSENEASALVLHEAMGKVKILSMNSETFAQSIEDVAPTTLIDLLDKTISRAEEILPPHIETHKTVFGVKDSWVDSETKKIKKEYLTKLKKVCDSLDLTPVGFMVTTEAIVHLLQEEDGAPLSAILSEIGKDSVSVSVVRGGKLLETLISPLESYNAVTVVDRLLRHVNVPVLPERIILFDSKITEHMTQQFIAHHWTRDLPFLHVPQVTVLPEGFAGKAIAVGAAEQMGFTMASLGKIAPQEFPTGKGEHKKGKEEEEAPVEAVSAVSAVSAAAAAAQEPEEEAFIADPKKTEDFGFVVDKDIADEADAPKKSVAAEPHKEPKDAPARVINESAAHMPPIAHIKHNSEPDEDLMVHESDNLVAHHEPRHKGKKKGFALPAFPALGGLKDKLALDKLGKNKVALMIIVGVVALALLTGGLIYFYIYQTKATVALSVTPEMNDESENVTFSTTAENDFSENIIAAKSVQVNVDGELSKDATGKKDVGEKAKGTITLYNNGEDEARVSSGTEVKSSSGEIFLTDKDVEVASASGDIFSGTKPGTADVAVTAKDIGSEANMPSGTKFAVGGNIAAKNDSAFSGGSKKSVTVVSKDDLAKLRMELPKKLEAEAKAEIEKKVSGEETLLPALVTVSVDKAVFDKKADDEAKKVKLTAIVTFAGIAYLNEDLLDFAKATVKNNDSNDDTNVAEDSVKAEVSRAKLQGTKAVTASVAIEAGLLPKINKGDVVKSIQNKSVSEAKETLKDLPQIAKSDITFSPAIPFISDLFPRLPNQIDVKVTSE